MVAAPLPLAPPAVLPEEGRRVRAKMRIYVLCQTVGWGISVVLQLAFLLGIDLPDDTRPKTVVAASTVIVAALGLLITHFTRPFMARWGWKQLGWRALGPRLFATAVVQSFVWSALAFAYTLAAAEMLEMPWISRFSPVLLFAASWMNGTFLLSGWLCIYYYYHLFDRYNRLQIEQLRLAATVKEAELRALKSQVNPHFIFNSLNSLRALIDEDPARARQAVTQLANLLRYSLRSAQSETVAFEDELRVVNDYLALEQVRHEERLRVRFDIAPDTLQLAVPPLLLQTLVENAVKYGVTPRPEGGEVAIVARREEGQLRLQVINPGEFPPPDQRQGTTSTGLGLKNAADRLRVFFGDRARLQLRTEQESLVVAEVSIPVQTVRP